MGNCCSTDPKQTDRMEVINSPMSINKQSKLEFTDLEQSTVKQRDRVDSLTIAKQLSAREDQTAYGDYALDMDKDSKHSEGHLHVENRHHDEHLADHHEH